jgi:aminomethyltransferase
MEIGYPNYGNDIDRTVDPVSAGLGGAVPPSKSGYVGAEAVARIRANGPRHRRIGLTVDGSVPSPGMSLLHGGEVVGMVSSSTFSPTLENGIVIAYVPVALSAPGTRIEVEVSGEVVSARVVEMPFVSSRSLSA